MHNKEDQEGKQSTLLSPDTGVAPVFPPTSPLHEPSTEAVKRRTLEAQRDVFKRYLPYKKRAAPPPLELRFAARTMGRSSCTDMSMQDVDEDQEILFRGLSQLSDRLIIKAVEAKRASRDCILQRVALTRAEIESAERHIDLLTMIGTEDEEDLEVAESQLSFLRRVLDKRQLGETKDDAPYYHAVYADELVALTIAGAQVEQMEQVIEAGHHDSDDTSLSSHSEVSHSDKEPFVGLLSSDDNNVV
ncbi:hypothetical protein BU15DRAFT_71608 [Melanogaster broomeanus]|nr:hypothetical protein BU15DRAFT_71608 [Melanogaster broomeanus]